MPKVELREGGGRRALCRVGVDDVNLLERGVGRDAGGRVLVERTKVAAEVELVVHGHLVLITDDDDATLGDQESEVVLFGIGEGAKIDAGDLGADCRDALFDVSALVERTLLPAATSLRVRSAVVADGVAVKRRLGIVRVGRQEVLVRVGVFGLAVAVGWCEMRQHRAMW